MKLRNEFSVDAPVDKTWEMLLDIQRVAQCLPGATIEPDNGDGVYRGQMKVRLGPMTVDYRGTATLAEVDNDERVATLNVKGKEARGTGLASATIKNSVKASDAGTDVVIETDLNITGRPAQFGRGIMEDVSAKMLEDFAKRLERELQDDPSSDPSSADEGASPAAGTAGTAAASSDEDDILDLGSAVSGPLLKRAGIAAAAVVVLVVLLRVLRPRSEELTLTLRAR
jgi:carbon monoxide dehydrogenase subunit G